MLGVRLLEAGVRRLADAPRGAAPTALGDGVTDETVAIRGFTDRVPIDPDFFAASRFSCEEDRLVSDDAAAAGDAASGTPGAIGVGFRYEAVVLPEARVAADGVTHVSVFDARNDRLARWSDARRLAPPARLRRKPVRRLPGTTLHLSPMLALMGGNFSHWLLDGYARVMLLQDRAERAVEIDRYLIPPDAPAVRECLDALGVPADRLFELTPYEPLAFERLVCVSATRGTASHVIPKWILDGYRTRLSNELEAGRDEPRRIYISRRDAPGRSFAQEERFIGELEARGYEALELSRLNLRERARLFAGATDVIGFVGAGMASTMFCSPGCRVTEIFPSNFVHYHFYTISAALGLDYRHYVLPGRSGAAGFGRHSGDMDVDVEALLGFLDGHDAR